MKKKTKAKCENNVLVVAFNNANPPLIWRQDLSRNPTFTVSLQGGDDKWDLGVTSAKGDYFPIASFEDRAEAEKSLSAVNSALSKSKVFASFALKTLIVVTILVVVIMGGVTIAGSVLTRTISSSVASLTSMPGGAEAFAAAMRARAAAGGQGMPDYSGEPTEPVPMEAGVPMSADDVLQSPGQ